MFTSDTAAVSAEQSEGYKVPSGSRRRKHQYHSVTALPVFDSKVPVTLEYGGSSSQWALLALYLYDAGYLRESDKGNVVKLCQAGMTRWINAHTRNLKLYGLHVEVTSDLESAGYENLWLHSKEVSIDDNTDLFIRFVVDDTLPQFTIGKKLTELEQLVPGLGKTAYYWLAVEGARHFDVFTPWMGRELASHIWWMGGDNMSDFKLLLDDEGMTEEEYEYPSPDSWDAGFPDWVNKISEELPAGRLQELAERHKDAYVREVAKAVLDLQSIKESWMPDLSGTDQQSAYSAIYLLWGNDDTGLDSRLLDDHMEMANMGADYYSYDLGLIHIPKELAAISEVFKGLENGFKQMENIERLINLVGVQL